MEDWLAAQARARPLGLALHVEGQALCYAELNERVARLAAQLAALGLAPGMRLGLMLPSGLAAALALHAALRLGLLLVPLNTRLTAPELERLLALAACDLLLYAEATAELAQSLQAAPRSLRLDSEGRLADRSAAAWEHYQRRAIDLDAPLALLFTSGTSGSSKGVVLSYGNFFAAAMASAYRIGVLPDDRWLCVLPLYHVGGLSVLLRSCLYGTAVDLWPRFETGAINAALAAQPITLISLVPTMLQRMLDAEDPPLAPRSLRLVLLGGAAARPELVRRALERGIPVAPSYGMTESTAQLATALPEQAALKPGSVGRPLIFTQVRVLDEAGREQPAGSYGEIVVAGPSVMQGYFGNEVATARALQDGWLHTGDIGYLDADGDLWLVQRRSDLIISGGENVYPAEVEEVLRQHPNVLDVAVIGLPSREWGQQVAAALVLHDPATDPAAILAWSRSRLAGYKQPRQLRIVAALPRSENGKLQRAQLLALFEDAS